MRDRSCTVIVKRHLIMFPKYPLTCTASHIFLYFSFYNVFEILENLLGEMFTIVVVVFFFILLV